MEYYAVAFEDYEYTEAVPGSWFNNEKPFCSWPEKATTKELGCFLKKSVKPASDWENYKILKCRGPYNMLTQARQRASLMEDAAGDVTTDVEGSRKKRKPKGYNINHSQPQKIAKLLPLTPHTEK
ncbi:unnamed protein product, partial [Allacma fusca]